MTTPISIRSTRTVEHASDSDDVAGSVARSEVSTAASVAAASSGRTRRADAFGPQPASVAAPGRERAAEAIDSALHGDPTMLMGLVMQQMRRMRTSSAMNGVAIAREARDGAAEAQRRAVEQAHAAAEKATGFLGLGKVFGTVALVAGVVAAIAASVVSGGTALAITGALLVSCADSLVSKLAEEGFISSEVADALSAGLKLTAGILMACSGGGLLVGIGMAASGVVGSYGDDVAKTLVEDGLVSPEVGAVIGVACAAGAAALSVASAGAMPSAAGGASDAVRVVTGAARGVANVTEAGAEIAHAGTTVGASLETRTSARATARALVDGVRMDQADQRAEEAVDALRSALESVARGIRAVRAASAARGVALSAALSSRA